MSRLIVMTPNTMSRAFRSIDALAVEGVAKRGDCDVLKALFVTGWQDGFVAGTLGELSAALGITRSRFASAIVALSKIRAVDMRKMPNGDLSIELLALCRPWAAGDVGLGWWLYHLVDDGTGSASDDDSVA